MGKVFVSGCCAIDTHDDAPKGWPNATPGSRVRSTGALLIMKESSCISQVAPGCGVRTRFPVWSEFEFETLFDEAFLCFSTLTQV